MKDGFVIRKPTTIHSRARARRQAEAKAKGRHTGYGEQQACAACVALLCFQCMCMICQQEVVLQCNWAKG